MDRRTFLQGVVGTSVVMAVAVPKVAKAYNPPKLRGHCGGGCPPGTCRPRRAFVVDELPDRYMIDGFSISPGDEFLQTGADNAADNGIYVATSTGTWERPA